MEGGEIEEHGEKHHKKAKKKDKGDKEHKKRDSENSDNNGEVGKKKKKKRKSKDEETEIGLNDEEGLQHEVDEKEFHDQEIRTKSKQVLFNVHNTATQHLLGAGVFHEKEVSHDPPSELLLEDEVEQEEEEEREEEVKKVQPALDLKIFDTQSSNFSFGNLQHRSASTLDIQLKNVLLTDSIISQRTQKSEKRKLNLLDVARTEAQICEVIRTLDGSDEDEDELNCCKSRRKKKKKQLLDLDGVEDDVEMSHEERWMTRIQLIVKWILVVIGISDFYIAIQDVYLILMTEMMTEYLHLLQIYNCDELVGEGFKIMIAINVLHAIFSVSLLYVKNKDTSDFALFWIMSQICLDFCLLIQAYFRSRFKKSPEVEFLSLIKWRVPVDFLQMSLVIFRYYKLYNPFAHRLKLIAASARLDRSLNNELRLRASPFLQAKSRTREAAAFQTLQVIRKVSKQVKTSGMRTREEIIQTEVEKALQVLSDRRRYPKKQVLNFKKQEKNETNDNETIFENISKRSSTSTQRV